MAFVYPVDRRYKVTSVDAGKMLILGTASEHELSFWRVQFVPDATWQGGFGVLSRNSTKEASDDGVNFGTTSYRRVQIGGVASDPSVLVQTSNPPVPLVNTDFIILVPADGLSIALAVDFTAGFGYLYTMPLRGKSL